MVVGLNGVFGLRAQPLVGQDRKQELGVSAEVQNKKNTLNNWQFYKLFAEVCYLMIIIHFSLLQSSFK